jgi:MGT family glycosyltransferase
MISIGPLGVPSRDVPPFGLALLPGKGPIIRARDRILNWISDKVILGDLNTYSNKIRRQLGLASKASFVRALFEAPTLVLQPSTPAFEYPRSDLPKNLHFIGPILPKCDPAFSPPDWWTDLRSERPVILINQGTIAKNPNDLIFPAIEGLRDQNMLVVAVPVDDQGLDNLPQNVRAEKFIPFAHLLPFVTVMVTNGGYGSVHMALAHGVPLVVAGATEDKMEVAARVEWSGAGINLRTQYPSPEKIREAAREVLSNPTYRENAQRIQRDFSCYHAPEKAAELLGALAERA